MSVDDDNLPACEAIADAHHKVISSFPNEFSGDDKPVPHDAFNVGPESCVDYYFRAVLTAFDRL